VLAPSVTARGVASPRDIVGEFTLRSAAVVITSGGIGGNHDLVRRYWPARLGVPPRRMLSGVPDHVDGRVLEAVREAGGRAVNLDRMWNYPEGVRELRADLVASRHPDPRWPIAVVARRRRAPLTGAALPGFRCAGALEHVARSDTITRGSCSIRRSFGRELALSGSEQNPDLTGKSIRMVLQRALPTP
jgi:predicted oxidoreductase